MTRQTIAVPACLLVFALVGAPTMAVHCNGNITAIPLGMETLYLDDRTREPGEFNHWMYLESNGVAGLQSGGDGLILEECQYPWINCGDWCWHRDSDFWLV